MRQEEERLLRERLQTVQFESRMARLVLGIVYAVALAAVALTGVSVLREMERRARTEEQLQAAQKQFRLLFDSNPIPVWVYDLETLAMVDVNASAVSRYGYSHEEFLRFKITDIRPPEDVPSLMDSVRRENESAEETGPWRHRKKSGEIIVVQIRSYPLQFYGRSARLVMATDITEKKRAEDALKESEERLRMIVTNIKDYAVITLDPAGLVTSWNGAAERIKGYRTEEIMGKHVSIFYLPEEFAIGKPTIELETAKKSGRFEEDGWRVRKDSSQVWANVIVTLLQDQSGGARGFLKITRDTTEKRKAEQELVRRSAELEAANKELESFSYSVSHDLRAPLRGIEGFGQALQEDYASVLDATGKNYLDRIRAGTRRMGVLIDDLLNLARVTRAEMRRENIDLSKMASDVAKGVARDGVEAVDYLFGTGAHAGRDLSALPQVVLLDLKLPKMDGFEVLERIRSSEATKLLPVVILTTSNQDQDRIRGYGLGANSFVRKPVEFDKFIEAVRQLGLYWLILNEAAPVPRRL
jgi:PAS domain S-box-containing protein